MNQFTPPNARKRKRYAGSSSSSSSSSSATITSPSNRRTPLAPEPLSPLRSHTPSHTAAIRQSNDNKQTVEGCNITTAGPSVSTTSAAPSQVKRTRILEPPLSCGLFRSKPAALSAHPEQTYYSERSYPTPLMAPPPGAIAAQVDEIRRCRAALKPPGMETETVAEKRQRQANERVFRYRKDRTYRILEPRFQIVIEKEVPIKEESPSTPRLRLESTPQLSSPVTVIADAAEFSELSSPPTLLDTFQSTIVTPGDQLVGIADSDDEEDELDDDSVVVEVKAEGSDVEMLEDDDGEKAPEYMDVSDDGINNEASNRSTETLDGDEEEVKAEASDAEVMTADGTSTIDAETESQRSTESDCNGTGSESESEDDDHESDFSDFSDTFQSKRKSKSKPKASKPKSKLAQGNPVLDSKLGLNRRPVQNQFDSKPVTSIPYPRQAKGVNQHGYSKIILPIPRVVKKK